MGCAGGLEGVIWGVQVVWEGPCGSAGELGALRWALC